MKFRSALLAATVLAAPLVAKAQPIPGPYVQLGLGGNLMTDQKIHSITPPGGPELFLQGQGLGTARKVRSVGGFAGEGSVGWSFGPMTAFGGPRVELEGVYTNNSLRNRETGNFLVAASNLGGTEQKYGAFVNAIWDFDLGIPFFYPYVGLGVGGLWAQWQSVRIFDQPTGFPNIHVNDTEGGVAYQGIIGAAFPIPPVPGLAVTTDFRFMDLPTKRNYSARFANVTPSGQFISGAGGISAVNDHNFMLTVGLKYALFAAPPPPPPAPPTPAPVVQPARSYLVFFDWDRYNLTDRARQIIREAAENSTRVQFTRIQVNGFTDTSGSAEYNQRLSVRRAQAVAAELVRNGVPRSAISVQGFGKTNLLVPTGDGVREPQNRRVEIIIQ